MTENTSCKAMKTKLEKTDSMYSEAFLLIPCTCITFFTIWIHTALYETSPSLVQMLCAQAEYQYASRNQVALQSSS